MVRQLRTDVERRETDLLSDAAATRRVAEQAVISELFAQENAFRALRVSDYIGIQDLARRLLERLRLAIEQAGEEPPEERLLRRGLNVILVCSPQLCREAMKRAMARCTEVVDAADLPETWDSEVPLEPSPLNLYGHRPTGLNTWEAPFADWLDRQSGSVIWWLRNKPQPRSRDAWAYALSCRKLALVSFRTSSSVSTDGRSWTVSRSRIPRSAYSDRMERRKAAQSIGYMAARSFLLMTLSPTNSSGSNLTLHLVAIERLRSSRHAIFSWIERRRQVCAVMALRAEFALARSAETIYSVQLRVNSVHSVSAC